MLSVVSAYRAQSLNEALVAALSGRVYCLYTGR